MFAGHSDVYYDLIPNPLEAMGTSLRPRQPLMRLSIFLTSSFGRPLKVLNATSSGKKLVLL